MPEIACSGVVLQQQAQHLAVEGPAELELLIGPFHHRNSLAVEREQTRIIGDVHVMHAEACAFRFGHGQGASLLAEQATEGAEDDQFLLCGHGLSPSRARRGSRRRLNCPYDAAMQAKNSTAPVMTPPAACRRLHWHGPAGPCGILTTAFDGIACGALSWQRMIAHDDLSTRHPARTLWRATVPLGTLAAGAHCIPSLVLGRRGPARYTMRCNWTGGGSVNLVPIAVSDPHASIEDWPAGDFGMFTAADGTRAQAGIDCLEAVDALADARLEIDVIDVEEPDLDLAVSIRPRFLDTIEDHGAQIEALPVPALSQMQAQPEIARHICSPVSVAMALGAFGITLQQDEFAAQCRHAQHLLFGIWPANLAAAWRAGAGGVIRSFDDAQDAARILAAGYPIVTSIRFEPDELAGAPLSRTGGHLVVLRGLGADQVTVNDPAAASTDGVSLAYDRTSFLRAWLRDRGAGYVVWPFGHVGPQAAKGDCDPLEPAA